MIRPRRSLLFMPGSNARALEKARNLPADGIILDLEDSVAPEAKALARDQIAQAIAAGGFGKREVLIRVNAWIRRGGSTMSPWPARPGPTAFWFPRSPAWRISKPSPIAWAISTPTVDQGLGDDRDRARGAACRGARRGVARSEIRLAGFVFGPNDISRETRIRMQPGRAAMIPMITHCILATRAHGLEILDGPYSDFSNVDGFAQECAQARDLGFDGKTLIHPARSRPATRSSRRRPRKSPKPARSSRRSKCRKTPRAARSSSTAGWWSGCTPRWRGARLRLPMPSRRWGSVKLS